MLGINCLQDLTKKLSELGFDIYGSHGWYLDTAHGRWTMMQGVVYANGTPVKNIKDVELKKMPVKQKANGLTKKKIKSAKI